MERVQRVQRVMKTEAQQPQLEFVSSTSNFASRVHDEVFCVMPYSMLHKNKDPAWILSNYKAYETIQNIHLNPADLGDLRLEMAQLYGVRGIRLPKEPNF